MEGSSKPAAPGGGEERAALARRIRVAAGREPGDLLLTGGRVVNVFTLETTQANVVLSGDRIAGVGPYEWKARETISLDGRLVLPGLVDAHMHLESSLLAPAELARLVVPRGTSLIVADPHEVANVLGSPGVETLIRASEGLPLDIRFMAPSCVPAAPWETAGAELDAEAVARLLDHPRVLGLAEMMNFPGVLAEADDVLDKLRAALARGLPVDGHAPGLDGQSLVAYVAAGVRSDHESTTAEEAQAKAALGMLVQVREGSSARNLDALLPLIVDDRLGQWCLATDDVHPDDLIARGHLDERLRRVVRAGVPLERAVRHASLVPARHYGFTDRGAVAPAYRADLVVWDRSLDGPPELVIHGGRVAARQGRYLAEAAPPALPADNTVRIGPLDEQRFVLALSEPSCPAIQVQEGQILTRRITVQPARRDGRWVFDPADDLLLAACVERHRASGRVGLGLVRGFGFRRPGAIGATVAHDSHQMILVGAEARDLLACAEALRRSGGGFVVAAAGRVLAQLPLPFAGLMSVDTAENVCRGLAELDEAVRRLGCPLHSPFGVLSFLSLSVIPELRITDRGLFDVAKLQFVSNSSVDS